MTKTFVLNTNTTVKKDNGFYVKSQNSVTMHDILVDLCDKTEMRYATRMAYNRHKPLKNVVLYELNHTHYDNLIVVVNDINALQNNTKNCFVATKIACTQKRMKVYIFDNTTGATLVIVPTTKGYAIADREHTKRIVYKTFEELIPDLYVRFVHLKADENCCIQYEQLSQKCKEMYDAVAAIIGDFQIPQNYIGYVQRNAEAYDVDIPRTHFSTVRNIYYREGTERGARNTIGHCIGASFNQLVDEEPTYVLDEQYLLAYLTIRYYQALDFEPNPELYTLCPECYWHGRREYIKVTHTGEPSCCKLCGTEVAEQVEFIENAERLF